MDTQESQENTTEGDEKLEGSRKKKIAGCSARFSNLGMWGWGVYRVAKQHAVAYFIASNPETFKSKYLTALRWGKHLSKPALKNTGKL